MKTEPESADVNKLLDEHAAIIVEDLLASVGKQKTEPWFLIVRRQLVQLLLRFKLTQ